MSEPKAPAPAAKTTAKKDAAPVAAPSPAAASPTTPAAEEAYTPPVMKTETQLHRQCFLHILTGFVAARANPSMANMAKQAARLADEAETVYLDHLAGENSQPFDA